MKILICNPNTNREVRNQAGPLGNTVAICPPLGIGYVTAVLLQAGHDARMYDFFGSSPGSIEAAIRDERPDLVGVSCFTEHRGAALEVARLARKVDPGIHVMFGGSHASFFPGQMLEHYPELDSIVLYEAEDTLPRWVEHVEQGREPASAPPGVAFRGSDGVVIKDRCPFIAELDGLPYPVREVENEPPYKAYPPGFALGSQSTMMATRGCPYRCQFCSTTRYWGSKYRLRGVESVADEMEFLVTEKKEEFIQFFDDAMTAKKPWILGLCKEIVRRNLRVHWEAITRANYVDEEICEAMYRAGCRTVVFGIESFSDRILKTIHKGITGAQAIQGIRAARNAGLHAGCLLMVGNHGESWETIKDSMSGIRAARPDDIDVCLTAVFPQTELYGMATEAGLLDDSYWLDESLSAPVYTVEHSIETLLKFRDALYDANWANNRLVQVYRALGLRKLRHLIFPTGKAGSRERYQT